MQKANLNGRLGKYRSTWRAGTTDQNMTLSSLNEAFKECPSLFNKTVVNHLPHWHGGFVFEACFRMAACFTQKKTGLPKLGKIEKKNNIVSAEILEHGKGIKYAVLNYTDSTENIYHERKWQSVAAEIKDNIISAEIPAEAHHYYLSAYEKESKYHDICGSTETIIVKKN